MGDDAEVDFEKELEEQLAQQLAALAEIDAAIHSQPDPDPELVQVKQQLVDAIQELEQALLSIKKERLQNLLSGLQAGESVEPVAGEQQDAGEPLVDQSEDSSDSWDDDEDELEGYEEEKQEGRITASDSDGEGHRGLGADLDVLGHARQAAEAGPQTETDHFAEWEQHSRGIASKLLARMGFIKGQGLGNKGLGITEPVPVSMLPSRRGLGGANLQKAGVKKKKKRGGERMRKKRKIAEAKAVVEAGKNAELALELQHGAPGLFAFINGHLGDTSEAAVNIRKTDLSDLHSVKSGPLGGPSSSAPGPGKRKQHSSRQGLIGQSDRVAQVKVQLAHLQESLLRNKDNKNMRLQLEAKLQQVQAVLRETEAEQARMHKAVHDRESEKKWLKF